MSKRHLTLVGVAVASGGMIAALTMPASADSASRKASPKSLPGMVAALQRDLHLNLAQARIRFADDQQASRIEKKLRRSLGAAFGGAWIPAGAGKLIVGTTDAAKADEVRKEGAQPKTVARSERRLNAVKAKLDRRARSAPRTVPGWYVQVQSNKVVVLSRPTAMQAAKRFVAASGADAKSVSIVASNERPRLLYDVRGGDAYYTGQFRCSIGFSINGGYVTAGHCGDRGATTQGFNRVAQGTFGGSSFPGNDYAWVDVNSDWTPRGVVNNYNNGTVPVRGSTEAAVGASICRSGSTTGWRCGTVGAKNQTVNYPEGTVNGLTRTNACAEGGDSGGSFIASDQAQGTTSGGSGNCTSGGTTFFQPVNEILSASGRRLVTS